MHTIKFRLWVYSEKKMYLWNFSNKDLILSGIPIDAGDEWTEDCEVMLFTERYDKNSIPIYEGDIVKYKTRIGIVEFLNCSFRISYKNDSSILLGNISTNAIEIIGNVFETHI